MNLCSSSSDEGLDQDDYIMYDEYKFELARKLYKEDDFEIEEIKEAE